MVPGKEILLLDGGLGTSLEDRYGVVFGKATPLWSSHLLLSDAETLLRCQKDFGEIPVDIVLTATYQISTEGLAATHTKDFPVGVDDDTAQRLLRRAIDIAMEATSRSTAVAISLGPYGACMVPSQEYSGRYDEHHSSEEQLMRWHVQRLGLFESIITPRTVSFVAFETIPRRDEIVAIRRAFSLAPATLSTLPFWTSCLFPSVGQTLPDGSSVDQAMEAMLDPNLAGAVPWGVGINCTKIQKLRDLVLGYESAVSRLDAAGMLRAWPVLLLYPDGTNGEVYCSETHQWVTSSEGPEVSGCWLGRVLIVLRTFDDKTVYNASISRLPAHLTCSQMAGGESWEHQLGAIVQETRARGNWKQIVVGGCCKASAEHIRKLGQVLRLGA